MQPSKERCEELAGKVKNLPPQAAAELRRILSAPARCGWDNNKLSGRLDRRAFGHAMAGSETVFKQRWESDGVDTAVQILIDGSGSMGSSQGAGVARGIELAYDATIKLARVMRTVQGAEFAVAAFDGIGGNAEHISKYGHTFDGSGNCNNDETKAAAPATIRALRRFGKGKQLTDAQLATISGMARGGTPDMSALNWAIAELTAQPHARKLLITITDGESSYTDNIPGLIAEANERGVDVVCLGAHFNVAKSYGIGCRIDTPEDMNGAAFRQIADALRAHTATRRTM